MGQKRENMLIFTHIGQNSRFGHIFTFWAHFLKSLTQVLYIVGISDFFPNFLDQKNWKNQKKKFYIVVHPNFKPFGGAFILDLATQNFLWSCRTCPTKESPWLLHSSHSRPPKAAEGFFSRVPLWVYCGKLFDGSSLSNWCEECRVIYATYYGLRVR